MIQFKEAEIEQANGLGLMMQGLNQHSNNAGQDGSRILINFEPSPQFLPDLQTAQATFGCGPKTDLVLVGTPGGYDSANPCRPGDLMSATGGESLA